MIIRAKTHYTEKLLKDFNTFGFMFESLVERDLRIYMAIGGMPQAVEAYVAGKNFSEIDMVKRQIITLYEEDFKKIDTSGSLLLKPFYLVPFISA